MGAPGCDRVGKGMESAWADSFCVSGQNGLRSWRLGTFPKPSPAPNHVGRRSRTRFPDRFRGIAEKRREFLNSANR